ncbi:hypothetical protein HADU_06774 [Acinetobacter sp. HA]|uniref:hypothetical protein n=1 Tax=Acinetobacter sp. HA TaxID=1173062 RepID=UPI000263DBF2|nr:hypothetical protein [Acinetobacter sp. HA]EIM39530.1 hypothetical protein HADU_06774 [Acinetobacter sp. HA]
MKIKEGGGMGIQNTYPEYDDWLKTNMQKLFESVELLPKEEVRDIIEVAGRAIWQAAKAQAVPEGFVVVSQKDLLELTIAINAVDLATHTESKTNEVREMWQQVALKLMALGISQEPAND